MFGALVVERIGTSRADRSTWLGKVKKRNATGDRRADWIVVADQDHGPCRGTRTLGAFPHAGNVGLAVAPPVCHRFLVMYPDATPASLSAVAESLYHGDGSFRARLARWRTHIAPFERIIAHVPSGASLLDVGCGSGLLLGLLAARRAIASGLGLDPSETAVGCARRMARRLATIVPQGAAAIAFESVPSGGALPARGFDVVTLVDVLHHVRPENQIALVRRAAACVAPGGRLIYKDMARRPLIAAIANRAHDLILSRQWIHYVPIGDVAAALHDAGFTIVARENTRRLVYAHELLVAVRPEGVAP